VRRIALLFAGIALAGPLAAGPGQGSAARLGIARFQMPSRNIGCGYASASSGVGAYLRCDVLSGLNPKPRRNCMLDWTGLSLSASGRGRPNCAGDTIYSRSAPVLRYGRTWKRGPFTCTSRRTGVTCRNSRGHGFFLARDRWRVF
jgi:hypothetical protein